VDGDSNPSPAAAPFDESDQVGRNVNALEGLRQYEASGHQTKRIGLHVFPEISRGPKGSIDVDAGKIGWRLFEGRELSAEFQIDRYLGYPILADPRIEPQFSVAEISEDVRLGEQQKASPC
jgi:hypothetical protein